MQPLKVLQIFKTYSVETINVSLLFVQDLKQGHYLKIPPRASFLVQCISTVLCVTCQIAVKEWIFSTVPDICERGQPDHLTCPRNRVFYSASTIWCVLSLLFPMRRPPPETLTIVCVITGVLSAPRGNSGPLASTTISCTQCSSARLRLSRSGCGNASSPTPDSSLSTCPSCSTAPRSLRPQTGSTTRVGSSLGLSSVRIYLRFHVILIFFCCFWIGLMGA